ncbi:gluconate 2-dehydrogenase subunit 3 family protein [Pseudonocardia sp.]|uniref:gluconate 2-dehydrogenase subunit 3 family protein n=1 Tax=Pseudonocardia sp. TaxID=60912 RepID=UPI003D10049C
MSDDAVDANGRPAAVGLTPTELAILDAVTERLIPGDETGPGAAEALVVRYIDRALRTAYASLLDDYRRGLAAADRHARSCSGAGFADLPDAEQDAVLGALEAGEAGPSARAFFALVRRHTIEGMFGDPSWGGNADGVGWRLLGYHPPRATWSAAEQAVETIATRPE